MKYRKLLNGMLLIHGFLCGMLEDRSWHLKGHSELKELITRIQFNENKALFNIKAGLSLIFSPEEDFIKEKRKAYGKGVILCEHSVLCERLIIIKREKEGNLSNDIAYLFDIKKQKEECSIKNIKNVRGVCFSGDAQYFAISSIDNTEHKKYKIFLFSWTNNNIFLIKTFFCSNFIRSLDVSTEYIALGAVDGKVFIFNNNENSGTAINFSQCHPTALCFYNKFLVIGSNRGDIFLYEHI